MCCSYHCITACPTTVYDDGTTKYCYFLYNTELASDKVDEADTLCGKYDADAHLAVIDTEAKKNHLASLGIFSGVTAYVHDISAYLLMILM